MIPAHVPSRDQVRQHACPLCFVRPGDPCVEWTAAGVEVREHNHRERVEAAQVWLGRQLTLPLSA